MKASRILWIGALVLSFGVNICWSLHLEGAAIQGGLLALGCFLYGAAHKINEK
jgi:hypothetical protein